MLLAANQSMIFLYRGMMRAHSNGFHAHGAKIPEFLEFPHGYPLECHISKERKIIGTVIRWGPTAYYLCYLILTYIYIYVYYM